MNKLFTKIVGVALGLTMAVGVGVSAAVGSSSKEVPVHAAGGTFTKITSTNDLTSGAKYLIVSESDELAFDGSLGTIDAVSNTKSVTMSSNSITATSDFYFTITSKTGGYSIKGSGGKYIGSTASNANELKSDTSDSYTNTITWDSTNSCFIIRGTNSYLVYNSTSGQTRFRFFKPSTSGNGAGTGSYHKLSLYKEAASDVLVTGVSVEPTSVTLGVGATQQLTPTVLPSNATNKNVSYSSSAPSIASVSAGGLITANAAGNATITVTTQDGSKTATCAVTVNYAAVTSVSLSENAAEIGLGKVFDYNLVTVTVSPSNANPAVTWSVDSNTVGGDYTFDALGLWAGDTEGTITLKCESDADSSKYATLVVTVTSDPTAAFVKDSTSGYAGKTEEIAFTYGNIDDESKIAVASSNPSIVSVANDLVADEGEGLVTINFAAAGSANVTISYDGGAALDTLPVTVSADSVVSVTWNASNFDVFSGTTLTSDIDNTWLVSYEMASGDDGLLEYGDYTLKLDGSAITLPHTWVAADSGKSLCVEYGGVSSSTVSVTVTQTINDVNADITSESTWSHSITTSTWTAYGAKTLSGKAWTAACGAGGAYWGYDGTKGQQFGKAADPCASLTLSSSAFSGTVSTVKVTTSGANDVTATVSVTIGSTPLMSGGSKSVSISATSTEYTFTGSGSGAITITWTQTSSKALYLKALSVTTVTSSGSQQIANNASHKAAQRVAVKFANAFNAAMDETENCTTGLSSAWSKCSSAYNTFKSEAAALGSAEEAYAKNLIKYATAQYSDDSGEACIERMMKTYEICVQKHGQTPFMSELVSLSAPQVSPLVNIIGENTNIVAIIVVISMISVTAIGGYFFLRKRKED